MKIALVSPYDFAYPGGVVNHVTALSRCLTRMGHTVKIIAPVSKTAPRMGDDFIRIGKPRPIPAVGSVVRITISIRLAKTIKRVLAEEDFDIIHLHEPFMPMLCSAILRFSDTVNVGTFHASRGRPGYALGKPISTYFLRRRARKLHGKIAVSPPARDFAAKNVPGEYAIIPNGIDLEHFNSEVPPIPEFCDNKKNILFVGRLEGRKGLIYLLKAYKRLKPDLPDTRLLIVGPGTRLRKRYENWVKRNNLKDVNFVGYVSYDDLPRYYRTADIYCSPATGRESFGIVLLEGMAMKKPVVASRIEGYSCVVSDGVDGILVPPKDEMALSDVLKSLLNDEKKRSEMGERAYLTAMKYRWEDIARQVCDFYEKVIEERTGEKPVAPVQDRGST